MLPVQFSLILTVPHPIRAQFWGWSSIGMSLLSHLGLIIMFEEGKRT